VLPGASDGLLGPSSGRVDFLTSARLTGIEVLDSGGLPLDAFSVIAGSDTSYDRNGVAGTIAAVPEPSTAALLIAGGLAIWIRRVLRPPRPPSAPPSGAC
jgi:hypothetical protein